MLHPIKFSSTFHILPCNFLFVDRPQAETLSATKFTEAINRYRKDRRHFKKLRAFIPDHISEKDFKYIIDKYVSS